MYIINMENSNIIASVLHLKEVSDLLINDEPDISYALLQLSKAMLDQYQIDDTIVEDASNIAADISQNSLSAVQL